jgi:hypothetical protein
MADNDADVSSEITPEEFLGDEAPKTDPSPVKEEAKAEPEKTPPAEEEPKEEAPAEPEVPEAKPDEPEKAEDEAEVPPQGEEKPLAPKSENRFQKLANENRELREQIDKITSETYAPQTVEELTAIVNPETGQPYTVAQAADAALAQQLQMRDYKDRAVHAQTVVGTEAWEVLNEFPMFNPDSKDYDKELASIAADTLEANLIRDPNMPEIGPDGKPTGLGTIVDFRQSPKQIYQTLARASGISAAKGQLKGQADTETMLANADTTGNISPPKKQKTPDDEIQEMWKEDD